MSSQETRDQEDLLLSQQIVKHCNTGEPEEDRGMAYELISCYLETLGYHKTVEAWRKYGAL